MDSDAHLSPVSPEDPPEGYPRDLEQRLELPDGDAILLRPLIPADIARMSRAFEQADIETLQRRFFTAAPPTDAAHLQYLVNVDYRRRLALLAMDEAGNSVGIGRYEAVSEREAEVAIVVAPDWRRRHIGSSLLLALEAPARRNGFDRFIALYLPSNKPVEDLLMGIGYADRRIVEGVEELSKRLDGSE